MPDLLKYRQNLVALGETIGGGKEILDWFLRRVPELAAFSYAVQGSDEAVDWLLKNGFPNWQHSTVPSMRTSKRMNG